MSHGLSMSVTSHRSGGGYKSARSKASFNKTAPNVVSRSTGHDPNVLSLVSKPPPINSYQGLLSPRKARSVSVQKKKKKKNDISHVLAHNVFARRLWKGVDVVLPATNEEMTNYTKIMQSEYTKHITNPQPESMDARDKSLALTAAPVHSMDDASTSAEGHFPRMTVLTLMSTIEAQHKEIHEARIQLDRQHLVMLKLHDDIAAEKHNYKQLHMQKARVEEQREVLVAANDAIRAEYPQYLMKIHKLEEQLEEAKRYRLKLELEEETMKAKYEAQLAAHSNDENELKQTVVLEQRMIKKLTQNVVGQHKDLVLAQAALEKQRLHVQAVASKMSEEKQKYTHLRRLDEEAKSEWRLEKKKLLTMYEQLEERLKQKTLAFDTQALVVDTLSKELMQAQANVTTLEQKKTVVDVLLANESEQTVALETRVAHVNATETQLKEVEISLVAVQDELESMTLERDELRTELDSMTSTYTKTKQELDSLLHDRNSTIQSNADELKTLRAADGVRKQEHDKAMRELSMMRVKEEKKQKLREAEAARLHKKWNSIQNEVDFQRRRAETLQESLSKTEGAYSEYKETMSTAEDEHSALMTRLASAEEKLNETTRILTDERTQRDTLQRDFDHLTQTISVIQDAKTDVMKQLEDSTSQLHGLNRLKNALLGHLVNFHSDVHGLQVDNTQLTVRQVQDKVMSLLEQQVHMQKTTAAMQEQIRQHGHVETSVEAMREQVMTLHAQVDNLTVELQSVSSEHESLAIENKELREQLTKAKEGAEVGHDSAVIARGLAEDLDIMREQSLEHERLRVEAERALTKYQANEIKYEQMYTDAKSHCDMLISERDALTTRDEDFMSQIKQFTERYEWQKTRRVDAQERINHAKRKLEFSVKEAHHEHGVHIADIESSRQFSSESLFRKDDLVEELNGVETKTLENFDDALQKLVPGDMAALQICRMGVRRTVMAVVLGGMYTVDEMKALRHMASYNDDDYDVVFQDHVTDDKKSSRPRVASIHRSSHSKTATSKTKRSSPSASPRVSPSPSPLAADVGLTLSVKTKKGSPTTSPRHSPRSSDMTKK